MSIDSVSLGGTQRAAPSPRADRRAKEDEEVIQKLEARDREVRAHEAAHVAAAGGLAGAPSYSYQLGPDGRQYAVGGSVSIDTSPGRTPEETLSKARRIRAAATAPADPSAQDMAVAARAAQMETKARAQSATEGSDEPTSAAASEGASKPQTPKPSAMEEATLGGGGAGHSHMETGCAFCARSVAAYAAG